MNCIKYTEGNWEIKEVRDNGILIEKVYTKIRKK